ncbi:hypothetical protein AB0K11_03200 [Mycobacterium sp. NPDC050551]|uniref:hypothetical protein n=1 Tax=Mycobacterium sp. NPDC050551 TaxID=3155407 RepID=UPI0034433883
MDEPFEEPVELDGSDSTRIRRGEAAQRLTLHSGGLLLARRGKVTEVSWRGIESIELLPMSPRWSTARAWAILGRNGGVIFPHEFDTQWTAGPIGDWLRHHRPDLDLPESASLAPLPLGIPNRQVPLVLLPGILVGIGVATVSFGMSLVKAALLVVGCLGAILLMVVSPRWERVPRYALYGLCAVPVLIALVLWLLE